MRTCADGGARGETHRKSPANEAFGDNLTRESGYDGRALPGGEECQGEQDGRRCGWTVGCQSGAKELCIGTARTLPHGGLKEVICIEETGRTFGPGIAAEEYRSGQYQDPVKGLSANEGRGISNGKPTLH